MTDEQDLLKRVARLIRQKQYDRARLLLEQIPDNPTAQEWLGRLDALDPAPMSFEEAQTELAEAEAELAEAEREIVLTEEVARRGMNVSVALLVFFGSLIGSLLGAAADLGEAMDTVDELRTYFDPEVCVVGSDTILGPELGVSQAWERSFEDEHDVRLSIDAIGSGNGVQRAANGECAHVLAMSEPMSDDQYAQLTDAGVEIACAAEIGFDVIVFITDINNPVRIMSPLKMSRILKGRHQDWSEVNPAYQRPITILARQGSGTTDLVLSNVAYWESNGGVDFPPDANYIFCGSNEDCLDRTLSTAGSLYWGSAAWIRIQPLQYLRVVSILQGDDVIVNPLTDRVDLNDYPRSLMRPLYMYVLQSDDIDDDAYDLAREFLRYVRGVQGQAILDQHFHTYFNQPVDFDIPLPPGIDPVGSPNRQICRD